MKKYISLLVFISIISLGVFGFASVGHDTSHASDCIAAMVQNEPCPKEATALSVHHIQAYISFFSALITLPFAITYAFFTLLIVAVYFYLWKETGYLFGVIYKCIRILLTVIHSAGLRAIIRWLSLFENSPSAA